MNIDFSNKKLIIFDFDGTLVDFKIDYTSLRSEIIEYLYSSFTFPKNSFSIDTRIFITLNKAKSYIDSLNVEYNWNHTLNEVDKIMKKWEWEAARKNRINYKVIDTLKKLKLKGLKLAIFTLEPEEVINYLLKKDVIESFIDVIASRDKVKKLKPNPEHINFILNKLKISAKEAIVIGDHKIDMECGKSIGALCIGIENKFSSKSDLIKGGADIIIYKISDLIFLMNL